MYVMTYHHRLIAVDPRRGLIHVNEPPAPDGSAGLLDITETDTLRLQERAERNEKDIIIDDGPLAGCEFVKTGNSRAFHLRRDGAFACADPPSSTIVFNRQRAGVWETFEFVSHDAGLQVLTHVQEKSAFAERVRATNDSGRPVCVHFGCGHRRISGFLHVDKHRLLGHFEDYFIFDFAESEWPIPDASVDYVYSEDFIEHIPQRSQLAFLTESLRVLKVGGFNRVSTPCLRASMEAHSDFGKGFSGFYFGEYDKWGHISLFTQNSLQEFALMVGYRNAFFTAKGRGTSVHAVPDNRPGGDRDQLVGNIFADLLK